MKRMAWILLLLAVLILGSGCTRTQAPPVTPVPTIATPATTAPVTTVQTPARYTVRVGGNPAYGQILTDGSGRTLYYFTKDTPFSGKSVCTAGCPDAWPPFVPPVILVSPPLSAGDFGTITRPDGGLQVTYRGWPLYHYSGDAVPGDTNGYGVNGFWFVMAPGGVVTTLPVTTPPG